MFNNKKMSTISISFFFISEFQQLRGISVQSTHCVLCITCIQELNGLDNKLFFLTNWEFDPQQFWQKLIIFFSLFPAKPFANLFSSEHQSQVWGFFFSFVQTKNWDNRIIYKVIFSLGLTLPSYTHNIPNLSPQVFSQVGASKFSFFFGFFKGMKSHHSIKYSNFGYLF